MKTLTFVKSDPPAIKRKAPKRKTVNERLLRVVTKLQADPGSWYRVASYASKNSPHVLITRFRKENDIAAENLEATVRPLGNGQFGLWLKWTPTDQTALDAAKAAHPSNATV